MRNGNVFFNSFSCFNSKETIKNRRRDGVSLQSNSDIINLKNIKFSSIVNSSGIIKKINKNIKNEEKKDKKDSRKIVNENIISNNSDSNKSDEQINFSSLLYSQLYKDSKKKIFLNDSDEISEIKEDKKMENSFFSGGINNNKNLKMINTNNNDQINQTASLFCPNKSTSKDISEFNNQKNNLEDISRIKTIKCSNSIYPKVKHNNSSENLDFITMNDIPSKFMLRMKKKLHRNKEKEKIKKIFKILKNFSEKNKNFFQKNEKYGFFSDSEPVVKNQIVITSSILARFQRINIDDTDINSTSSFEETCSKFDILTISKQASLKINSSYQNINEIYGGKLATNQKYKDELKSLITQYLNKTSTNIDLCMQTFNNLSLINKKLNYDDNKKNNNLINYKKSLITFAMESSNSINKYFVISNKSNNLLKSINKANEDNYNKNKKNILNDKINYTNSTLFNKPINSIDKLNNELNGNECKLINYLGVLNKNDEKNIQHSNDVDSIISNVPSLSYSQFNLNNQREMECEINSGNKTYNSKIKSNYIKNGNYSDNSKNKIWPKYSNKHSSIKQLSNGKKRGLISKYADNLDKLKIIKMDNNNKLNDSNENEFEVYKNNKSKCYIF